MNVFEVHDLIKNSDINYNSAAFYSMKKWTDLFFPDLENLRLWVRQCTQNLNRFILQNGKWISDNPMKIEDITVKDFLELDRDEKWIYGISKKNYIDIKKGRAQQNSRYCLFCLENNYGNIEKEKIKRNFTLQFQNGVKKVISITTMNNINLLYLIVQEVKRLVNINNNSNCIVQIMLGDNRIVLSCQDLLDKIQESDILDVKLIESKFKERVLYDTYT